MSNRRARLPQGVYHKGEKYEVKVFVGRDEHGKTKHLSRVVPTLKEAKLVVAELRLAVERGAHTAAKERTFADLAARWVDVNTHRWSPNTLVEHRRLLKARILPALGHRRVDRITVDELDTFYHSLYGELSAASVKRIHGVVRAALEQAVKWRWRADNPAMHASLLSAERPSISVPANDDLDRLEAECRSDVDFLAYLLVSEDTGCRRSEAMALRWDAIDLDGMKVSFVRKVVRAEGGTAVVERGKTQRARRTVAISPVTAQVLNDLRRVWRERLLAQGEHLSGGHFVFAWSVPDASHPLYPDSVSRRFRKLQQRAGVSKRMRLHDLRHRVATTLLAAGVPDSTVGARLGHSPSTTRAFYSHYVEAADREAVEVLVNARKRSGA